MFTPTFSVWPSLSMACVCAWRARAAVRQQPVTLWWSACAWLCAVCVCVVVVCTLLAPRHAHRPCLQLGGQARVQDVQQQHHDATPGTFSYGLPVAAILHTHGSQRTQHGVCST
jgi:hypothetical protein